jgi:hypothetical protein
MSRSIFANRGISWVLIMTIALLAPVLAKVRGACADEYHTPLAGEELHTTFMEERVDVPAQDRGHVTALVLGATYYDPKQGDITGSPIGAFYLKRVWESSRTRDMISIFVNDLEYDKSFGNLELVTRFDNYTIPGGQTETLNNQKIDQSSVEWGTLTASLGPGLRFMVPPLQNDNDLRLQLLGKVGYFYVRKDKDSAPTMVVPPDTVTYGMKLRGRYDGMRRNLLELPHSGVAAGFDFDYTYRDKWADWGTPGFTSFKKSDGRDYNQFTGYLMGVATVPFLSEKNKILASVHGGTMAKSSADRFNCFRIGGGPLQGESDDLFRPNYPGTMFNNLLASDYVIGVLEYRRELTFFMYLHLRDTYAWADHATVTGGGEVAFKSINGNSFTVGLDTGFFWNSELYLGYNYDNGFIRDGKSGSGYILTWNKSF